ncbi:hypothetical protein KBZ21_01920 [Streptomyces sp. A73]|nr:hypothetical protein [Streptomyces sp. A73]
MARTVGAVCGGRMADGHALVSGSPRQGASFANSWGDSGGSARTSSRWTRPSTTAATTST